AGLDVVAAAAGGHLVVAVAGEDGGIAGAGGDGVVTGAAVDDHVDLDVRGHGDGVVAVAGTEGQLLAVGHLDIVGLTVDGDAQRAVGVVGDLHVVVGTAGGEHQLVVGQVLLREHVHSCALALDGDVAVTLERVHRDGLAVGGLLGAAHHAVLGAAVDTGGVASVV